MILRSCLVLLALLGSLSTLSGTPPARERGEPKQWGHETSDIPADPRIHFGALPSGMRFAWMANGQPERRCYLRLHVDVGSLVEEDGQQGMAHFLEHMAFNGLRGFPGQSLIEWLQEHGMAVGVHSNATTGFDSTVYNIDLPESDPESLREGLEVLRAIADGMLLDGGEVEKEKGVIDAEQRERDSAQYRAFVKRIENRHEGTRIPRRLPIGLPEVRRQFTAESLRAFYQKWYRPEHMTLIIVGDLRELDPRALIEDAFDGFEAPRQPLPERPPPGHPTFQRPHYAIHQAELSSAEVTLSVLKPWKPEADTAAGRVRDLILVLARSMFEERLTELTYAEGASFLKASVGSAAAFQAVEGEQLSVISGPDDWKQALFSAEQELRRVLEHGFHESELDEVRETFLRGLTSLAEGGNTRSSLSHLSRILAAAERGVVASSADAELSILRPAIEDLTPQECHQVYLEAWSEGTRFVEVASGADLEEEAPQILRAALEESRKVPVERPPDRSLSAFAYASAPGEAGRVIKREHIEDLDLHQIQFENGVRVNIKQTDFKENQVLVEGWLGEGLLTLEPSQVALSAAATRVFEASGLQAHSAEDLDRIFAGRQVSATFSVAQDHFVLRGTTRSEDLLAECELMAAYLSHPGWRPEGMRRFKAVSPRIYARLRSSFHGPLQSEFIPALHNGDPRFGLTPQQEVESVTRDQLRRWLTPHLQEAPLEVTFVGDLEVEAVVEAAARTLALLPPRRPLNPYPERRQVTPPQAGLERTYFYPTGVPQSLVYVAFPTTDGMQAPTRRGLAFLSNILQDRLRAEIRENLGEAYETTTVSRPSKVFPGFGVMTLQAVCRPQAAPELKDALLQAAHRLGAEGVSQEEVDRMRQPILTQLRDARRSNEFWMANLAGSQSDPEKLDELRNLYSFYQSVGPDELSALAQRFLDKEKASWAIVLPQ